jgi:hypothetical protein
MRGVWQERIKAMAGLDIGSLFDKRATVEVDYEGAKFEVTYAPQKYTSRVHHQVLQSQVEQDFEPLCNTLEALLLDWSIVNGKESWPPTRDNIETLPINMLLNIVGAIMTDVANPNGNTSPVTSPQAA